MKQINLRVPEDMLERIDRARQSIIGTVPREAWIRDQIELALRQAERVEAIAAAPDDGGVAYRQALERATGIRSSSQSKHGVRPIPKGER